MASKFDKVIDSLVTKWETDTNFKAELSKDPQGTLEKYAHDCHMELDAEDKAKIAQLAKVVKKDPNMALEEIRSKRC